MTRKWILLVLVLSVSCTVFAQQKKASAKVKGGDVQSQIGALEDEGREAALKNDTGFAEKYLAPDYVGISGLDGRLFTREETLQQLKAGDVKYQSIDLRNRKIRVYGNTAVVNAEASVRGSYKGQDFGGDYRGTRVWVKEGSNWKIVLFQTTPIRAPAGEMK